MIRVLLFASLRESLATGEVSLSAPAGSVAEVIERLGQSQGPHWISALQQPSVVVAVNQTVCDHQAPVKAGDEVAFYPPVTGG